jgi:hypothetical protein
VRLRARAPKLTLAVAAPPPPHRRAGYVVYLFFSLLVELLGGPERVVQHLENRRAPLYRPWPLKLLASKPYQLDARFLQSCKVGVMQFCVVRPVLAVLAAILYLAGVYERGNISMNNSYIYLEFLVNVSVTWAVWCLVIFFLSLRESLSPHDPIPKFVAIKGVVFVCFWQSLFIAILARAQVIRAIGTWSADDVAMGLSNLLICFEMLLAALYHSRAFPWELYNTTHTDVATTLDAHFALSDARRDFGQEMANVVPRAPARLAGAVVSAAVGAVSGKDKKERFVEGAEPLLREEDQGAEGGKGGDDEEPHAAAPSGEQIL